MDSNPEQDRIVLLGASRGLGRALLQKIYQTRLPFDILAMARSEAPQETKEWTHLHWLSADFSRPDSDLKIFSELQKFNPTRVFYLAGGGPYGPFGQKEWKDHQWALQVTLLFPMRLTHWLISSQSHLSCLRQLILIGSSVAEAKPDPLAASYATAKHGLLGLHSSLRAEGFDLDFRLYSPPYMDTDLLPPKSKPRQEEALIQDPKAVACDLWDWAQDDTKWGEHRKPNLV